MRPTRRQVLAASLSTVAGCSGFGALGSSGSTDTTAAPVTGSPGTATPDTDARLGFVGDCMLGRNVDDHWDDRDPAGMWSSLRDRLDGLDGFFCNLECCLSTRGEPKDRVFTFRADPEWAVPALRAGGVSFVTLANNHVLDFGPPAFRDTLAALDDGGIAHAGAGRDRTAAHRPAVVSAGGLDVAVVAFTDRYPAYRAGDDDPGTAYHPLVPEDPDTRAAVQSALDRAANADPDLVVATLHWGENWKVRPTNGHRRFARWLIEAGVDVVHGHSAHVIQGIEVYQGCPILYDTGDFVDDYAVKEGLHNDRSFLFELAVADGTMDHLRLVPVEIVNNGVYPADVDAAAWLRERMRTLSAEFETTVRRDGKDLVVPLTDG